MITREAKIARLKELADEFWEAAPNRMRQVHISKQMDALNELKIRRGDEAHQLKALIDHLGLDFEPAKKGDPRADRWIGNLSGIYDDGYGLLYSLYEAELISAKEMADAEVEAPYKWLARIRLDLEPYMLEYTEGDVTIWSSRVSKRRFHSGAARDCDCEVCVANKS